MCVCVHWCVSILVETFSSCFAVEWQKSQCSALKLELLQKAEAIKRLSARNEALELVMCGEVCMWVGVHVGGCACVWCVHVGVHVCGVHVGGVHVGGVCMWGCMCGWVCMCGVCACGWMCKWVCVHVVCVHACGTVMLFAHTAYE